METMIRARGGETMHKEAWEYGYLATLQERDGEYIDAEGVTHSSWDTALGDLLGFCGCGAPDLALDYVRRILLAVNMKGPADFDEHRVWYHGTYRPALDAIFHGDPGAEYLAFYMLTDKGLLEHGGSVPGWLTDLGKSVLVDLEEWKPDEEEESVIQS